jgi:WD40 repeat protein
MRIAPASAPLGVCVLGFALASCAQAPDDPFAGIPGYPCQQGVCLIGECVQGFCVDEQDEVGEDEVDESESGESESGESETGETESGESETGETEVGETETDADEESSDSTDDGDSDGDPPTVVGASVLWTSNLGLIPSSLEFSPDDSQLAKGGWDGFGGDFLNYVVANGNIAAGPLDSGVNNYAVSWSPDGDRVASLWTANVDYAVLSPAGQTLSTADGCYGGNPRTLAWHPNAEEILVGVDQNDRLCLKNAQTGATIEDWAIEGYQHDDVVWSNSGARFATYVTDLPDGGFQPRCIIHVFDRATLAEINVITLEPDYCEYSSWLAWRPGTQMIYATGSFEDDGIVARMNATGGVTGYFGADAKALAFSPDGSKLAIISDDGYVWIVDPDTWDVQYDFWAHDGFTLSIAWSHDGQLLATGGEVPRLRVWQLQYSG